VLIRTKRGEEIRGDERRGEEAKNGLTNEEEEGGNQ
jgi:hypothetical protein